ncbi:MAG: ABC transporter permease [Chloroflexi bacterium]|nr:ABC transporter permease [Chloroflexota bacterium]
MARHLARRVAGTILSLLVVSLITYIALMAVPGDAASAMAGESASTEQLQTLRTELGLDQPLPVRYGTFLANLLLRGDLGRSFVSNKPVSDLLLERLPYTFILALAAITLATALGILVGVGAALRAGTLSDTLLMGSAALGLAVPTFWSALVFMMLFSLQLHWLPVVGADSWRHLILPALTLALPTAAVIARLVRSSLLDTFGADYVRTAYAKGLSARRVLTRHVLRNSLIPVVTVLGLHLGYLLGGAFVVETIFGWPGLGRLAVQAIFDRDYPVILGATLTVALIYLTINLVVDVAQGWLDPQVAHEAV